MLRLAPRLAATLTVALFLPALSGALRAENEWNPFRDRDDAKLNRRALPPAQPAAPPLSPMDGVFHGPGSARGPQTASPPLQVGPQGYGAPYPGQPETAPPPFAGQGPGPGLGLPPPAMRNGKVEVVDLDPVLALAVAPDGGGLPADLWRGLDMRQVEEHIAPLAIPPRSPVLHGLWTRLLTATAEPPAGGQGINHFLALQLEALYRTGRLSNMKTRLDKATVDPADPLMAAFRIRYDLASGNRAGACEVVKTLVAKRGGLPKGIAAEAGLLSAYCLAADKNMAAAGLAADLAREDGIEAPVALAVLDALASGGQPKLDIPPRILVLDFRLMQLVGPVDPVQVLDRAEPALLAALALAKGDDVRGQLAASEAAARILAIEPAELGDIWRSAGHGGTGEPLFRRAELFTAIEAERAPERRAGLMRSLIDDARKSGLAHATALLLAPQLHGLQGSAGGDVAIEIALVAGNYGEARRLAANAGLAGAAWGTIADLVDPAVRGSREERLGALEDMTRRNRFSPEMLHRLAIVLDALDVNVPIPLWEAASRTPLPATGYLPETGVLPQLQDAAKKKEVGRTILLALRTLGPAGAEGAHMIGLGDTIRALRQTGLDAEARRLALEALLPGWPRG